MADESSRYQTISQKLSNQGLLARYLTDDAPQGAFYFNLLNIESRTEGAIASALGRTVITTDGTNNTPLLDANVHSLGRLKGLTATYRYAGAGANLYRRTGDTPGAYTQINSTAFTGDRLTMLDYRPDLSSEPYLFFADLAAMLKDNGTFATTRKWGAFPPSIPAVARVQAPEITVIDQFEIITGFAFNPGDAPAILSRVNTTLGTTVGTIGVQTVSPPDMTNILPGMLLIIDTFGDQETVMVLGITTTTFTAQFTKVHLDTAPVVDSYLTYTVPTDSRGDLPKAFSTSLNFVGGLEASDDDVIQVYLWVDNPLNLKEIDFGFDVGDGTFNSDKYWKKITPDDLEAVAQNELTALEGLQQRVFDRAAGRIDVRGPLGQGLGNFGDILPPDDPTLTGVRPVPILRGMGVWSRIQVRRGEFVQNGLAGTPGHTWDNVNHFDFTIITNENGPVTVGLDDFILFGGYGPDVFGGEPYDYRYTGYNADDGTESNPSPIVIPENRIAPERQSVMVSWSPMTDNQLTHYRVYRRGGTLSTTWYLIAEVPTASQSFLDTVSDEVAQLGKQIEIDNDPPVTSTLPTPVNTTLGTSVAGGSSFTATPGSMDNIYQHQIITVDPNTSVQEQVVVQSLSATQFIAYFQYPHDSTAVIKAFTRISRPVNIGAIAFDTAWMAGDPDNPHVLYYSKRFNVQAFPPQNTLEIGTPSDPIMGVIFFKNVLFVATESTWYQILGAETAASSPPFAYPTGSSHGLRSRFGWAIGEGMLLYVSDDGIYDFTGMQSVYMSEPVEWVWRGLALGPVVPLKLSRRFTVLAAYFGNEFYFSYMGNNDIRHRLIYSVTYKRWRNDDAFASAIYVEKDIPDLLYADGTNGMIYQDRVGNFLSAGFSGGVQQLAPMSLNVQTAAIDLQIPKNDKVWNEFTIDINTGGIPITLTLIFDNGNQADVTLGMITSSVRDQFQFNVNAGKGQVARTVALRLTGTISSDTQVQFYQAHIRAFVEAEWRDSYDSYWTDFGEEGWKFCKQTFIEYNSPTGVNFSVYTEGNSDTPAFTFSLPPTSGRFARKVRFPAVKAKLWRFVGTAASPFQPFQLYSDRTAWEVKSVTENKGYVRVPMVS